MSRSISGTVVDEHRRPHDDVHVNVVSSRELKQISPKEGAFVVAGLETGTYTVWASGFLVESDKQRIVVDEDGASDVIELVLRSSSVLNGVVTGPAGPQYGATVIAVARHDRSPMAMPANTDADGRFSSLLPPGTREADVIVAAQGLACSLARVRVGAKETRFDVRPGGGTLVVDAVDDDRRECLVRDGAVVYLDALTTYWGGRKEQRGARRRYTVPMMEPGAYTLCSLTWEESLDVRAGTAAPAADRCRSGFLPAFGSLELAVN